MNDREWPTQLEPRGSEVITDQLLKNEQLSSKKMAEVFQEEKDPLGQRFRSMKKMMSKLP